MKEKISFDLTKKEMQLILVIRRLKFGKLEIDIRDGSPQNKVKQKEKIVDISKIPLDKPF